MGSSGFRVDKFLLLFVFVLIFGLTNANIGLAAEPPFVLNRPLTPGAITGSNKFSALKLDGISEEDVRAAFSAPSYLENVSLSSLTASSTKLVRLPEFKSIHQGKVSGKTASNAVVTFSIDPNLQRYTEGLISRTSSPHVGIVAMEPSTGRILAMAEKSPLKTNFLQHNGLPAASLFKIVTTSAALEAASLSPYQSINFRGGTYTLNRWNYLPNARSDNRSMTIAEALGLSCNPVFSRIVLKYLKPFQLRNYARNFGFNSEIPADFALPMSSAEIPLDNYGLGRTAAGFGDVTLTPIHAVAIMSGIANGGFLPKPSIIDRVSIPGSGIVYEHDTEMIQRMLQPDTAKDLLEMMVTTTTSGTSKREFIVRGKSRLPGIRVAAKTGTLSGTNPKGVNHWFVAAAPISAPKIAIAVIVVDPKSPSMSASRIGRMLLEQRLLRKT